MKGPVVKNGRIIWQRLLDEVVHVVHRCEWWGCQERNREALCAHHIWGRGMGGAKRDDSPWAVAVLCSQHHTGQESAHDAAHASRESKELFHREVMLRRPIHGWNTILAFMEEHGLDLEANAVREYILELAHKYGEPA